MTPSTRIRIFLLSDVRLYRDQLAQTLAAHDALDVIGAAPADSHGLQSAAASRPDIVLVEGLTTRDKAILESILVSVPGGKVVAFGVPDEECDVIRCAEAGVAGYVPREGTVADLIETIQSVARGEFPCSPRAAAFMVKRISSLAAERLPLGPDSHLTVREREIGGLLGEGLSNKEIACRLGIEVSTVKNHVHRILGKLHATRRWEAAVRLRGTANSLASAQDEI